MKFAVFIIAYNASDTIIDVYERIPGYVKTKAEEIYVIDDCSQDSTFNKILKYKKHHKDKKLKIFRNKINLGYGGNQKKGYDYALTRGFDLVIMLHGDAQYAPEKIGDLIAPFNNEDTSLAMVMGSRMLGKPLAGKMPLHKFIGNKGLTFFQNILLGTNLSEFHSGYRCYSCKLLSKIPYHLCSNGFSFDTEIIIMLLQRGYKIEEVEIPTFYGTEKCHVPLVKYGLNCVRAVIEYKLSQFGLAEFERYALKTPTDRTCVYPIKGSPYSSHSQINAYILQGLSNKIEGKYRVLDLGCGTGIVNPPIAEKIEVVGIDEKSIVPNRSYFKIYQAKIDDYERVKKLELGKFDLIIAADILEHLVSPEEVLIFYSSILKTKGKIIISLPNVANIFIRLSLLFGFFNYNNAGILDRTHIKFFTQKTAIGLVESVGYEVKKIFHTPLPFELIIPGLINLKKQSIFLKLINSATKVRPTLFAYQFILIAGKKNK